MQAFVRWISVVVLSLVFSFPAFANESARTQVVRVVDKFKTDIVADKLLLAKNNAELIARVDRILSPVIDFDDFSKKVMGKYYRRATDAQKMKFAAVTKETLLKTYGGSFLEFNADKVNVLPLGPQSGREVRVNVEFTTDAGAIIAIVFYMMPGDLDDGAWLLSNVVINDINFGLTFRKQFAIMVQNNQNDIDKAIDAWKSSLVSQKG